MQTVYKLYSEWDIGHEGYVFASVQDAQEFARESYEDPGMGFPLDEEPFDQVWGDLIGTQKCDLLGTLPSPVKGYTPLSEAQLTAMNRVKTQGVPLGEIVADMRANPDFDQRWVSIGATHLQTGLMALTRAAAKPEFF